MLAPSGSKMLKGALTNTNSAVTLPAFLVPAFQSTAPRRQFSSTTNRSSKLGRTPISIPPGVELTIGEPIVKKDPTTYLKIPKRTVTVTGPLGKLDMQIPPYIHINHDEEASRAVLSIEDTKAKQQKEMWGMRRITFFQGGS